MWNYNHTDELYHYGITGMKWGVRRFQRKNGTLTSAGKKRYTDKAISEYRKSYDKSERLSNKAYEKEREAKAAYKMLGKNRVERVMNAIKNDTPEAKKYSRLYDEMIESYDIADKSWAETKDLYSKTGSGFISRALNNIKYDIDKK